MGSALPCDAAPYRLGPPPPDAGRRPPPHLGLRPNLAEDLRLLGVVMAPEPALPGLPASPPSSSIGADPGEWTSCLGFGEADRMRRDRRERPRHGGRERDNEPPRKTAPSSTSCGTGWPSRSAAG